MDVSLASLVVSTLLSITVIAVTICGLEDRHRAALLSWMRYPDARRADEGRSGA